MSFVEGFYSFRIDLTHADRSGFEEVRCKVPKYPSQPMAELYADILALCHGYRSGMVLVPPHTDDDQPTAWRRDPTESILDWIQVGVPSARSIKRALRLTPKPSVRVYFWQPTQAYEFCKELRGSTENWVAPVQFFTIAPDLLEQLEPLTRSRIEWSLTFVDDSLYLAWGDLTFESAITPIDIWTEFQASIRNV